MASILDHPIISQRYFFPRACEVTNRRVVRTRDGCELHCAHSNPSAQNVVVHFHGNGETASDWEPILGPLLADNGWSLVLIEYRGYGGSAGAPMLAAMLSDGEDVVHDLGIKPENVVALGRSIGSLYAVELAYRLPLAGLILDSGIHDLAERLLLRVAPIELGVSRAAFDKAVAEEFDQAKKLSSFTGPTLLLHARDDNLIDLSHAERNARACRQPTLRVFDRGGHNALYAANQAAYQAAVCTFLGGL